MKFDCYLTSLLASVTRMSFRRVNMGSTWPVRHSQEFRAVEVFFLLKVSYLLIITIIEVNT